MSFPLRVREVLAIMLLTLLVVTTTSLVHHFHVIRIVLRDTLRESEFVARQIYAQSARALSKAPGEHPLEVLGRDRELRTLVDASVGYSPDVLYALISDQTSRVVVDSDAKMVGEISTPRPQFNAFLALGPLRSLYEVYYGPQIYEAVLPLDLGGKPLGAVRVGIAMSLVRGELRSSLMRSVALAGLALLAALVVAVGLSNVTLRPIRQLAADMDRLRHGEFDVSSNTGPRDEFGKLAFQLQLLGRQISSDRARLLSRRTQFQSAVEHLEDGIMFVGPDHRIVSANRAVDIMLGKSVSVLEGTMLESVFEPDHPLRHIVEQAFERGTTFRNATIAIPVGETSVDLLASVFPIVGAYQTEGAIVLLKDVRSVAVSARTLQSLIRYAAQLTALGRVTAEITHEVKNPLNAMVIHAELLAERLADAPDEVHHSLEVIRGEIRQLDAVVQKFLQLTRSDEVALKPLDLNGLLQNVVALFEAEWRTKGITFAPNLERHLPPIPSDEELLRRAFVNILLNACEAMPNGGTLTLTSERAEGDFVRVAVTDTGAGIPTENIERIFTMYFTTKPGGTGMGLSLARRIVELHGGDIEIKSKVGHGTSVIAFLPTQASS